MRKSRTEYALKNFASGSFSVLVNGVLQLVSRTVFVYTLGETYLGVNGLLTNVVGILSFAELGISSAIGFNLYKPLAENDREKIKAYIRFYKIAYIIVAAVVTGIGLAVMPFLHYFTKGAEEVANLYLIYGLFLFNTVSSYLISYKSTILTADQENYLLTNINLAIKTATGLIQIVLLLVFRNFLIYLLTETIIQLAGKIYINRFVNKRHPYLKEKNTQKISEEERNSIFKKIKALTMHKLGEVSIFQTDNIITSAFISVTTVGLVSNYVMIVEFVKRIMLSVFGGATAGLGNLIVTEDTDIRYRVSKRFDYLGFVLIGWGMIMLYFCLPPFVKVWMGPERMIDGVTVALICANFYTSSARAPMENIRTAAGLFEQDQWVPVAEAVTNIIVSVICANYFGLKGIYIGTLVSSLFPAIARPVVVYKYVFNRSCASYFKTYGIRVLFLLGNIIVIKSILSCLTVNNDYLQLVITVIVSATVPLLTGYLFTHHTEEFKYIKDLVMKVTAKLLNRWRKQP